MSAITMLRRASACCGCWNGSYRGGLLTIAAIIAACGTVSFAEVVEK